MAFYNNPAFGQAASNIAAMFAPPSGSDAAGWANAKATQAKAQQLQWLFDNSADPTASNRSALTGVQSYGATPEGFRYNVDEGNAAQRYGYDTQAATSLTNNAADNERAIQTNVLDNQRSAIGTLFQPLNPGQIRPDVPSEFMDALQLPEVAAVAGAPKPLNEGEVKGARILTLPPEVQDAIAIGSTPIEPVLTENGPRNVWRQNAIDRQPAPSGTGTPRGYITPDNRRGTTLDGVTDAANGERLPQGTMPVSTQGTPEQTGLTTSTRGRVEGSEIAAQKFQNLLGLTRELANDPTNFGIPGFVKGGLQDVAAMANGVSKALGYTGAEEALAGAQVSLLQSGIDPKLLPGVFDPDLAALQTTSDLLVFQAAAALAGQSGRDVSDRDVQMFKSVVGDPRAWTATPERFKAKLDQMERILNAMREVDQNALGGNTNVGRAPPPEAAPPPAAAPDATGEEQWERGPDGKLRRVSQ